MVFKKYLHYNIISFFRKKGFKDMKLKRTKLFICTFLITLSLSPSALVHAEENDDTSTNIQIEEPTDDSNTSDTDSEDIQLYCITEGFD